ncbi:cytochrome P450 [Nocardia sp. NPDC004568]|uniref:cytochrome P450 n=1 Tax=Nocardia sp. NPDC004568 TaxID=3154551 RepID=UPI0033BC776B
MLPTAPRRVPLLGHIPALLSDPMGLLMDARLSGDVVQLYIGTRRYYLLNSPEFIHQLLVTEAGNVARGRIFEKARVFTGQGLATSDGTTHRKQRRIMQPAFHARRMTGYAEIIQAEAASVASSWTSGQKLALDEELGNLTLAIITRSIFSDDYCEGIVTEVRSLLPNLVKYGFVRTLVPDSWERFPGFGGRQLVAMRSRLENLVREAMSHYRSTGSNRTDLLSMLLDARYEDTGLPMSDDQLCDEVISLLFTGSETVATTLSWLFHELGRNPAVESRLHAELDMALQDGPLTYTDLSKLRYLNLVLNEALRLHSPAWFLMRQLTAPIDFGEFRIPAGAEVVYSSTALHRDPAIYPDPMRFDPDRWTAEKAHPQRLTFIPFGMGRHQCLGYQFARTEASIVVAAVASRWHLLPDPRHTVRARALTTLRPNALRVTARRRSHSPED